MNEQLRKAIQQMSGTINNDNATYVLCKVDSVDAEQRICNVTVLSDFTASIPDVQLMAGVEDGFLLVPSVDSQVVVCVADNKTPYVSMFSQLDKVLCVVGDMGIEVTSTAIKLNDGSFDGLVKIADLVTKLNNLENIVNDLITKYNAHTHPYVNVAAPATTSPTTSLETDTLTLTQQSDLENTSITHGEKL